MELCFDSLHISCLNNNSSTIPKYEKKEEEKQG